MAFGAHICAQVRNRNETDDKRATTVGCRKMAARSSKTQCTQRNPKLASERILLSRLINCDSRRVLLRAYECRLIGRSTRQTDRQSSSCHLARNQIALVSSGQEFCDKRYEPRCKWKIGKYRLLNGWLSVPLASRDTCVRSRAGL